MGRLKTILSKEKTISVIVPVYNKEIYIGQCIESILNQSFVDFELILVDDGSTDGSGEICNEYSKVDSRVKVFHKMNGGVSSARNMGLNNAKGEWVAFVDSDDYIKIDYLKGLFDYAAPDVDLVMSFPEVYLKDRSWKIDWYDSGVVENDTFYKLFSQYDIQEHTSPWAKLYKLSIIDSMSLRFDDSMHFGEDAVFLYEYLTYAGKIYITDHNDYCYRGEVAGSLSKKINDVDSEYNGYCHILDSLNCLIKSKHIIDTVAVRKANSIVEQYEWRVLNSLYHNDAPFDIRMHIMRSMDFTVLDSGRKESMKEIFLKKLLINEFFGIYDVIRSFKKLMGRP